LATKLAADNNFSLVTVLPQISRFEHDTAYQDDDLLQLQVLLHVGPDFVHDSLSIVDGGVGEKKK